jgi:hypothetical protein
MPADGKTSGAGPRQADAVAGQPFAWLLSQSHLIRPGDVTAALAEAARALGLSEPRVYLADMQQRHLMPLPEDRDQASQGQAAAEPLLIETTTAGQAYREVGIRLTGSGSRWPTVPTCWACSA